MVKALKQDEMQDEMCQIAARIRQMYFRWLTGSPVNCKAAGAISLLLPPTFFSVLEENGEP